MLRELERGYRLGSGHTGPVIFVMHPTTYHQVKEEATEIGASIRLDREAPLDQILCLSRDADADAGDTFQL